MRRKNNCLDCGKKVDHRSKRCHKHANILINNKKKISWHCKCGKKISWGSKQCKECYLNLLRNKKPHNYKGGRPKCVDCGKLIWYGFKRCKSCANIKKWQNLEYRENIIKAQREGMKLNPNKPEKLLNKLLQKLFSKEYKYVGDGKILFCGFNPDFININGQKKIIEMYGDYWHKKPEVKERDRRRQIAYKQYGYKTLIVWEKELQNKEILIGKLTKFQEKKI